MLQKPHKANMAVIHTTSVDESAGKEYPYDLLLPPGFCVHIWGTLY